MIEAAGILFISGGRVLLLRRAADSTNYPGYWCFPGGTTEEGETAQLTALRETLEETGYAPTSAIIPATVKQSVTPTGQQLTFTTFVAIEPKQFIPVLDGEHDAFQWVDFGQLPEDGNPIHPGTLEDLITPAVVRLRASQMTETDVAHAIVNGALPSPQRFHNVTLFAIRITGTGTSYRTTDKEYVYRAPENYMTGEFLERCNGLSVIFEHPEKATLNSKEFKARNIGSIVLPYLREELAEVWGIAKIYDDDAIAIMSDPANPWSTSPNVLFKGENVNSKIELDNGSSLLIEGKPFLLDHIAVCEVGVWDKGGPPTGIELTNGVNLMSEEEQAQADAAAKAKADAAAATAKPDAAVDTPESRMDAAIARMDAVTARMDAQCSASEAKAKADAAEVTAKADAAIKEAADAEVKAKADAAAGVNADVRQALADMEKRLPVLLSDADHASLAHAQARADSVERAFGGAASRAMPGETVFSYRKRLAAKLKSHSPAFAKIDVAAITDEALFEPVEATIYADAAVAARRPSTDQAMGELREVIDEDRRTGRRTSTFIGDPKSWMQMFTPPRRMARINPKATGVN